MHIPSDTIPIKEEPNEEAEASISSENVSEDSNENLNRTVAMRRKAAKRTLPWDLEAGELDLVSPQLQAEDISAASKKRRIEEPLPATTDEAARKTASTDASVALPPPLADNEDANINPMADETARATGPWTSDEDAKLISAVANTSKKKWGNDYKTDWAAVAALVPGRTKSQCYDEWHHVLDPSIDRARERTGKWAIDEDIKLKDSVERHGGKDWAAITALVPGRTKKQCCQRWYDTLNLNIDGASERTGKWTPDEDSKLKDAVQSHGGEDWDAISALVPGRTRSQCYYRWSAVLDLNIDQATGRAGKWAEDEDSKLKDALQTHGGKNWVVIAALVPGRTISQCRNRWHNGLNPSIDRANGRTGKWAEDEDSKLKDAVQTHGGKDWDAISALVLGRTKSQCCNRWYHVGRASGRTG
jgi:hypothetical protein